MAQSITVMTLYFFIYIVFIQSENNVKLYFSISLDVYSAVLEVMKFCTINKYVEPVLEPLIRRVVCANALFPPYMHASLSAAYLFAI